MKKNWLITAIASIALVAIVGSVGMVSPVVSAEGESKTGTLKTGEIFQENYIDQDGTTGVRLTTDGTKEFTYCDNS